MGVPIVREVDMNLIWYCFMGMTAVADLIKRMIPGWMFWGFGVIGAAGRIMEMVWGSSGDMAGGPDAARRLVGIGCSVAVGGALLVVSRLLHGGRSVLCGQRALCAMEDKSGAVVLWADVLLWLWNDVDYLGRCQGSSGSQNVHSISTICVNCGNIHEYQSYVAIISGR